MAEQRPLELRRRKPAPGEPVATAWMQNGDMVNAFPHAPCTSEQWAREDRDGYWSGKGYSEVALYFATPHPLDALLPEICQLLDTAREDFKARGLWTEWDQSVRDRITAYNLSRTPGVQASDEEQPPCPVCGGTERSHAGYLLCECPAGSLKPALDVLPSQPNSNEGGA